MCDQRYAEFLVRKLHVDTHPALLIPGKIQAAVDQFQHMDPAEIIDHYLKQEQRLRTQKLIRKVGFYPRNDTPGVELLCPIPNRPLRVAKSEADAIFNRLHTSNTSYTSKRSDASVNMGSSKDQSSLHSRIIPTDRTTVRAKSAPRRDSLPSYSRNPSFRLRKIVLTHP